MSLSLRYIQSQKVGQRVTFRKPTRGERTAILLPFLHAPFRIHLRLIDTDNS